MVEEISGIGKCFTQSGVDSFSGSVVGDEHGYGYSKLYNSTLTILFALLFASQSKKRAKICKNLKILYY